MATARTPDPLIVENIGSLKLLIATFAATTDAGDTWASGLSTNVIAYWAVTKQAATTNTTSGVGVAESSGAFTFYPEMDNVAIILFVVTKGG